MALLLHLSDLHLDATSASQGVLLEMLVGALGREKEVSAATHVVLVITGDVFDSAGVRPSDAVRLFLQLHARFVRALGCDVPTIVLPGNHDRRWRGLVGPHRPALFEALRDGVDPRSIFVAGCRAPFLTEVIPATFHGLPVDMVAYDSTQLAHGWVSAGGMMRQEDLLHAHAQLGDCAAGRPLVVLMHHHLIPTPLTDLSFIESRKSMPRVARWLLGRALPAIVSNADREELTMTALGAGSALSTLHTLGRAVLLLHGHKHVPTARLMRGLLGGSGDVLIASAGSGGKWERLHAMRDPDGARLWPSFNALRVEGERVDIESVSFSPKKSTRPAVRRDLARVTRRGMQWEPDVASAGVRNATMRVERDEARFTLMASQADPDEYWDYVCERRVHLASAARLRRYVEFAHTGVQIRGTERQWARQRIELSIDGVTRYEIAGGLRRAAGVAVRARGTSAAFESIRLLSRYGGKTVILSLAREGVGELAPFGSETELATGRERPVAVEVTPEEWRLRVDDCPPRTLLRMYWPLPP